MSQIRPIEWLTSLGVLVAGGVAAEGQVTFTPVNVNAEVSILGVGLSGDGRTVVAGTVTPEGGYPFRWSQAAGNSFPFPGRSTKIAVNFDGSVVVAGVPAIDGSFGRSPAIWSASGGLLRIPTLLTTRVFSADATAVSNDGTVVVGTEFSGTRDRVFRWTAAGGTQEAIPAQAGLIEDGVGISGDGQVVVGSYVPRTADGTSIPGVGGAVRWTQAGGMQNLGVLPGFDYSRAIAANTDGSVVVGVCYYFSRPPAYSATSYRAFRWTSSGGMQSMGVLDEYLLRQAPVPTTVSYSRAIDVSADGNVVLIMVYNGSEQLLYRWVNGQGARPVPDLIAESGVSTGAYTRLARTSGGLSDDGTAIATTCFGPVPSGGQNYQACLIRGLAIPTPSTCSRSDVAGANQAVGPDGGLSADDIIVYLGWFFAGDERANVAGADQSTMPDSRLTADDVIVFLGRYFAGC